MAGTDLYWGHGERALRELSEALGIPVFLNGLARGCLPADHPNFFSRARSAGAQGRRRRARDRRADGLPPRLRRQLRRGHADRPDRRRRARTASAPRELAGELYGGLPATLAALREAALDAGGGPSRDRPRGATALRTTEDEKRAAEREQLEDDRAPLHPLRVYKELGRRARPRRDRDRRRRRLRLLRRPRDGDLRARLLARPGPVRLPRLGPGLRDRGQARAPRQAGLPAARRRRLRLLRAWSSTRWCATACRSWR